MHTRGNKHWRTNTRLHIRARSETQTHAHRHTFAYNLTFACVHTLAQILPHSRTQIRRRSHHASASTHSRTQIRRHHSHHASASTQVYTATDTHSDTNADIHFHYRMRAIKYTPLHFVNLHDVYVFLTFLPHPLFFLPA